MDKNEFSQFIISKLKSMNLPAIIDQFNDDLTIQGLREYGISVEKTRNKFNTIVMDNQEIYNMHVRDIELFTHNQQLILFILNNMTYYTLDTIGYGKDKLYIINENKYNLTKNLLIKKESEIINKKYFITHLTQ